MSLPIRPLPASSVEVNGSEVHFRSLSRSEAFQLQTFQGHEDDAEVFIISHAVDVSEDEAREFRDKTPMDEAGKLVNAILIFSALATPQAIALAEAKGDEPEDPKPSTNAHSSLDYSTVTSSS